MLTFARRIKSFAHSSLSLWAGLLLSLAVGGTCYFVTYKLIQRDASERFIGHARTAGYNVGARIKSYSDALRGTASLFQTHYPVTRDEFHGYVNGLGLERNFPAIFTINFAEYIVDKDRAAFDQSLLDERSEELDKPIRVRPGGKRPVYHVLKFIEPDVVTKKINMLGFDLYSDPLVQETLDGLRDDGVLITSGMPVKAMSRRNKIGLGMRLPIYRRGMPAATVADRRAAYIGSVGIAFWVDKLVGSVIDEMPIKHVRMTLVDNAVGVDNKRGLVLFDSAGLIDQPLSKLATAESITRHMPVAKLAIPDDRYSATIPVDFNGREWLATFSIEKNYMSSGFEERVPWVALLAGFISTLLLYALYHSLASSRERALRIAGDMTSELRDSQARLQLSHQRLRRLVAHADQIKEDERKRIAREIHDDLGQNLLALRIEADMLSNRTGRMHPHLHARARATVEQIDTTIKSVRQIINDLRPNVLDLGLGAAVEWQVAEFKRRTNIACELVEEHKDIPLDDDAATALFRILQESLSNVVRHSAATRVKVELRMTPTEVSMAISDNGVGLKSPERHKSGSFGLVGIEERIHLLNGSFVVTSVPGSGTTVLVTVPYPPGTRSHSIPLGQPSITSSTPA